MNYSETYGGEYANCKPNLSWIYHEMIRDISLYLGVSLFFNLTEKVIYGEKVQAFFFFVGSMYKPSFFWLKAFVF